MYHYSYMYSSRNKTKQKEYRFHHISKTTNAQFLQLILVHLAI